MVDGSSGESGEIARDSGSISWTSDCGPFDDCGWLSGTMKDRGGESSTSIRGGGRASAAEVESGTVISEE